MKYFDGHEEKDALVELHGLLSGAKESNFTPGDIWKDVAKIKDKAPIKIIFNHNDHLPSITDMNGCNLLHYAPLDFIELLVKKGVDIDCHNNWGDTPLISAINDHKYENAKLLIKLGADVNAQNSIGWSILHWICDHAGNFQEENQQVREIIELMIEKGAAIDICTNSSGYTPLHDAASRGSDWMCELLIEHGANIEAKTKHNETPLALACNHTMYKAALVLVSKGADLTGISTIHFKPDQQKHIQEEGSLIAKLRAELAQANPSPRQICKIINKMNNLKEVKLALDNVPNLNEFSENGDNLLFYIRHDLIGYLVEKGVDINKRDNNGTTPLIKICMNVEE